MSDNLNLTAEQVAGLVRRRNPDYYEKFTDEQIIRSTAQHEPGIYKNIRFDTLGEKFYKQYGNDASAGFAKRFGFQMGQLWDGTKTGMVGLFTDAETGEEWRRFSENLYMDKVGSDPELQAYFAWKEDEPGWSNVDTWLRSMSEALPSLAVSATSAAAAYVLIPATAGASLTALGTAISMTPMFAMEAGNEYNEVMKLMVDEMGLDPKEAKKYATTASIGYGIASSFLERVGARGFLGSIGIKSKVAKKTLADKMTRAVIDAGVDKNTLVWAGSRLGAGGIRLVEGAFKEGATEGAQALIQTATNRAIELGYGDEGLPALDAAYQAFKEAKTDPAVYEEAFAGATMGAGGLVTGTFVDKSTLDKIAAEEAKKREERVEKVVTEKVVEQEPISADESSIFSSFLEAVTDPGEKMGEVLSAVGEETDIAETDLAKAIRESEGISDPSKKILSVIQKNPALIDEIAKAKNSKQLLDLIYEDLNKAYQKENEGKKLPKAKAKVLAYAKEFATRGTLTEKMPDVDDTQFQEQEQEYDIEMAPVEAEEMIEDEPTDDTEYPEDDEGIELVGATVDKTQGEPAISQEQPTTEEVSKEERGFRAIPNYLFARGKKELNKIAKSVGIKNYTQMGQRELAGALAKKKLELYEEPNKRVILETDDDAVVRAKVDGKEVELTENELSELSKAVEMQGSAVKITKGFGEVALLEFKDKLLQKHKDVQEVAPAPPIEVYDEVKTPKKEVPSKKIEKDDTVSLTKDISNMLKKKKLNISAGYKKTLEKVQKLMDKGFTFKKVDNYKDDAKTYVIQAFDENGKPVQGGKIGIPKVIGGKPTIELTGIQEPQVAEEPVITQAPPTKETQEVTDETPLETEAEPEGVVSKDEPGADTIITSEISSSPQGEIFEETEDETQEKIYDVNVDMYENPNIKDKTGDNQDVWVVNDLAEAESQLESIKKGKGKGKNFANKITKYKDHYIIKHKRGDDKHIYIKGTEPKGLIPDTKGRKKGKPYNIKEVGETKAKPQAPPKKSTKKEKKNPNQNIDDIIDRQTDNDDNVEFQDDMSSEEQLLSENKELAEKIKKRLKKFFPSITTIEFEGLVEEEGLQRIGFALNKLAAWSVTDGRMDTIPHEYAHIFIKLMRNENIVKRGLKMFNGEENIVKLMGLYFAGRMRDTSLLKKFKIWLKQFANRIRRFIGREIADEDVFQFIAEEFYQGRWLGLQNDLNMGTIEYDTVNNETDTPNDETHEATQGEADVDLTDIPSDLHQTHMFMNALGIYIDRRKDYGLLIDMAKKAKSYGQYKIELMAWAKKLVASRDWETDDLKDIVTDSKEDKLLRLDWLKQKSRIRRYIPGKEGRDKGRQGNDTRIMQRWITNGNGVEIDGTVDLRNGKAHPETYTMNFIEQQFEGTDMRLFILPLKQILGKRNYKGRDYYVQSQESITEEHMEEVENDYIGQYIKKFFERLNDVKDLEDLEILMDGGNLLTVVGTKLGDNSAILSTKATNEVKPTKIDRKTFEERLEAEVAANNITNKIKNRLLAEADAQVQSLLNAQLPQSININQKVNELIEQNEDIQVIKEMIMSIDFLKAQIAANSVYSQSLARIKFWQEVRTPNYMMEGNETSAADSLTRMSIDMAEGIRPIGIGTGQLMVVDENTEVRVAKVDSNGKPIPGSETEYRGKYGDYDGATFTSSSYLGKIAKNLGKLRKSGYNPLRQLKTFIRKRTVNDDGTVDYLGMKHMQFTPFKGMQFYQDGVLIAQVEGQGANTYFRDMNPESATYNQKFDMIASRNEVKVAVNGHDVKNQLITIEEEDIVVHSIMDKSKLSASHPIALGEMLLTIHDSREAKALLKAIEGRYSEVIQYYTTKINQFFEDPAKFREFIKTEVDAGKVPTELQEYFELIKEDGMGIMHPALITHILPVINATILRNGILKARAWGKKSSLTYLKPAAHLRLQEGEVAVSGDNKVAIDEVERRYLQSEGLKKIDWATMGNNSPFDNKLTTLNKFLETNDVDILIHRNPIAKVTGPVLRKVRSIVKGNQGEVIFLSNADVVGVLDGDWDGDKAAFEFISDSHIKAMKNWQNSDAFKKVDKQVLADLWGARTDKDKSVGKSTVISQSDMRDEVINNAKSQGGTGVMVNGKTLMAQLFAKDFKIDLLIGNSTETVTIADPNELVIMDYKALDKDQLTSPNLQVVKSNNDSIVTKDGKKVEIKTHSNGKLYIESEADVFLQTTKSHEISTLFQMAVDAVKYRHWGEIVNASGLDNYNFMLSKIFQRANGQPIDGNTGVDVMMRSTLALVLKTQNISRIRQGRVGNNSAKYDDNLLNSRTLKDRMYNEDDELLSDKDYATRFVGEMMKNFKPKSMARIKNVRIKNRPSPAEQLITGIDMNLGGTEFQQLYSRKDAQQLSHVMAMDEIWESIKQKKEYAEYIAGENIQDAIDVAKFLHESRVFENSDKKWSFSAIWHKLQKDMGDTNNSARTDLIADMTNFVDRFIDEWNGMSDNARAFATIEMLSGFKSDVNVLKIPPLKLMDKNILKIYLPAFERHLRNMSYEKVTATKKSAKDTRVQVVYLRELNRMFKEQEQNEEYIKACPS